MIHQYKDYQYIVYVMGLSFFEGYTLFKKCKDRIINETKDKQLDKLWDLYLIEIQHGCKQNFEDFCKDRTKVKSEKSYNNKDEKEIIKKYKNLNFVRRVF